MAPPPNTAVVSDVSWAAASPMTSKRRRNGVLGSGIAQELVQRVTGNVFLNGRGGIQDIE
jgi:hypothetical protein